MIKNVFGTLSSKCRLNNSIIRLTNQKVRSLSDAAACTKQPEDPCKGQFSTGLVVGLYTNPEDNLDPGYLTPSGDRYNKYVCGRLTQLLRYAGPPPKLGEVRVFYNICDDFSSVAVAGLGVRCQGYNVFEQIDESKESIRIATAAGCRALQQFRVNKILVDSCGHSESSAEGAALGIWLYQEKKEKTKQVLIPDLELYDDCDWAGWHIGLHKASAQNLARQLMDTPANLMTPKHFTQNVVEIACTSGIDVSVKVKDWCEQQHMNAFLAVAQGSCEPPTFLELTYHGGPKDERPVVLIGTGLTYNSGGINLKSPDSQIYTRGEVGGAACVLAAMRAASALQLPINIRALIPLCEHMPGCAAIRPGDIVRVMNGKTIYVEATDAVPALTMVDALVYAKNFWPRFIVDVGTMSTDMKHGLGTAACGVFSNSEILWEYMLAAAMHSGDKVWRFPLWNHFSEIIHNTKKADIKAYGDRSIKQSGESCRIAAILREFVPCGDWLHMDTYGTTYTDGTECAYLRQGMTGRPTRTLVEFLSQLICNRE